MADSKEICRSCGASLHWGVRFCPECGAIVRGLASLSPTVSDRPVPFVGRWLRALAILLGFCLVLGFGLTFLQEVGRIALGPRLPLGQTTTDLVASDWLNYIGTYNYCRRGYGSVAERGTLADGEARYFDAMQTMSTNFGGPSFNLPGAWSFDSLAVCRREK